MERTYDDSLRAVRATAMNNMKFIVEGRGADLKGLYADDGRVWHSFSGEYQSVDRILAVLAVVAARATRMSYEDLILHLREDGWVQEHLLTVEFPDTAPMAVPAAISVELDEKGKIALLKEYIDGAQVATVLAAAGVGL